MAAVLRVRQLPETVVPLGRKFRGVSFAARLLPAASMILRRGQGGPRASGVNVPVSDFSVVLQMLTLPAVSGVH